MKPKELRNRRCEMLSNLPLPEISHVELGVLASLFHDATININP